MSKRSVAIGVLALLLVALGAVLLLLRPEPSVRPVATLQSQQGERVERDFAQTMERWEAAPLGATFALGDGVRTGKATHAGLLLFDDSALDVQPSTTLRFLADGAADDQLSIDLSAGEALIRVGKRDLKLRSHVGLAVISAGSEVTLQREEDALNYQVKMGTLRYQDDDGARTLKAGDRLRVGIGVAVMNGAQVTSQPAPKVRAPIVLEVKGKGARIRNGQQRNYSDLAEGTHELPNGTELKLPAGTHANVKRANERAQLRGAGEYVLGAGDNLVDTRLGDMSIESQDGDVLVGVPGGLIVVRAQDQGSRAAVRVAAQRGDLTVERGTVTATLQGDEQELHEGDTRSWQTGMAQINEGSDEPPAPDYFNVHVAAGESFVLHSPELPVSVALDFSSKCPEGAEVELGGKRSKQRAQGSLNVLLNAGTRSYTVRCLSEAGGVSSRAAARGSMHVIQDAGTRKLPPTPPTSIVDADGRSYTIYYPNQLPEVSVRWPNPPDERAYQLELDGTPIPLTKPEHTFKSGSLRDGTHALSFRGTTRRSRTTTVIVKFDNNAPTASLIEPGDRSFNAGSEIRVQGVALQAWNVSLDGGRISKESDGRFAGTITPSAARPDIAVRLSHPRLGIHYYLRRAASSK